MSFDVFVQCYGETENSGLPLEAVRALFPVIDEEEGVGCWVVRYDDLNGFDIYAGKIAESLSHFMVSRPTGDIRLWEALLSVMKMGKVVMFWPGGPPLLAKDASIEGLPEGMVESLGEPVFIERAEQFLELLKTT